MAEHDSHGDSGALVWEARFRPLAGGLAIAAAVLTIAGPFVFGAARSGIPSADERIVTFVEALARTADGQPIPPGRLSAFTQYVGENPALFLFAGALLGLGALLAFAPLGYLYRATRARRPQLPRVAIIAAAIGAVAFGIGELVASTATYLGAVGFADAADRSNAAAADALGNPTAVAARSISQGGQVALAVALVLIPIHAMRAGLFTRFMGFLGVIVGLTLILPLDQLGIMRAFWLAATGALILGRWPAGVPLAWTSGREEPWPTRQQIAEERRAAAGAGAGAASGGRGARRGEEPTPAPAPPTPRRPQPDAASAQGSATRRKRKRRSG